MQKIKLTKVQEEKLLQAFNQVASFRSQAMAIQSQLNAAANHQNSILEMIYEVNKVDPKTVPPGSKITVKDGYLNIAEANASDRIRNAVKNHKPLKSKKHGNQVKA